MKVRNLENRQGRNVVNQFVIFDGDKIYFQSYESLVAVWNEKTCKLKLGRDWDYSRTTVKYLKIFTDYYTPYALDTKKEIEKLIKTGEIEYDSSMN